MGPRVVWRGDGRRGIIAAATAAMLAALVLFSASAQAKRPARYFKPPAAAFTNKLGSFPERADCANVVAGTVQPLPTIQNPNVDCPPGNQGKEAFQYNQPAAQPGLGVPLGGVGSGSFMINQAGSFGPWDFGNANQNLGGSLTQFEDRILPQAAFHVREQVGRKASVKTLAVNAKPWDQLPKTWNTLNVGDGTYGALWPFGWTTYKPFKAGVSMRFWSPIVDGNNELTSMPIAFFDVRLANTTRRTEKLSVMFTLPNASPHKSGTVRKGLTSRYARDKKTGVRALTLSSSSPENTPDAKDSDWTIAAKPAKGQRFSYVPSWNADGDGKDVYAAFSRSGRLPNKALDRSASAGAIAVSVTLKPGRVATIPFAMSWDFPQVTSTETKWSGSDEYWMRRYTSFFGGRETAKNDYIQGSYPFHQGFAIADRMLARRAKSLRLVRRWWGRIVNTPEYPAWLVREALNEEIHMTFNQAFWESGKITDEPSPSTRIGTSVPGTHLFCSSSGGNWGDCNEWDTDSWGYLAEVLLWPNVERDRLRAVVQENLLGVDGVGETGVTHVTHIQDLQGVTGRQQFSDVPNKSIYRLYTYYRRTGDKAFLRFAYPSMLKMMKTLQAGIHAPDLIPADLPGQEDSYDAWHAEGHNIYNAELWLLTMEIMIDATQKAHDLGVPEASLDIKKQLQADLPATKSEFEALFWNPAVNHYTIDPGGAAYQNGFFIDTFFAQQIATTLGLPALVPIDHEVQHLLAAYPQQRQNFLDGHWIGPTNMAPNTGPLAQSMQPIEEEEIWPGSAMEYAGTFLQASQATGNRKLWDEGLEIAHALEYWMTEKVSQGFLFEEPGGWEWNTPAVYRSPSFSQERTTLGVLHTIKPIVKWAVPAPPASEYPTR